jgi:hypothetical protein
VGKGFFWNNRNYDDADQAILTYTQKLNQIWQPQTGIGFTTLQVGSPSFTAGTHFRIIDQVNSKPGRIGSRTFISAGGPEVDLANSRCRSSWLEDPKQDPPGAYGINVIVVDEIVDKFNGIPTGWDGFAPTLSVRSTPTSAYCLSPSTSRFNIQLDKQWMVMAIGSDNPSDPPLTLAHELGHVLQLSHGDGIDNDGNGLMDEACDTNEKDTGYSVMSPYGGRIITEAQRQIARASVESIRGSSTCWPGDKDFDYCLPNDHLTFGTWW